MTTKTPKVVKVKALVADSGPAAGQLVVGGSTCAVGATTRQMARTAKVELVDASFVEAAAAAYVKHFPGMNLNPAHVQAEHFADQQRMTRRLAVGTLVVLK
jgi:hypothetical protein